MYWIFVDTEFEASHGLRLADGTREEVHAHRWQVTAAVCSAELDGRGFVMDFVELKQLLDATVKPLTGKPLEKVCCFGGGNASAEAVAGLLYDALAARIVPPGRLDYIEVTEAAGCRARYRPNG